MYSNYSRDFVGILLPLTSTNKENKMKLFTVAQAAETLAWSELSLRKLIVDGKLQVVRLGRSVRVPQSELDRLTTRGT